MFHDIQPGDHRSSGEEQFEASLAISRAFIAERGESVPAVRQLAQVEGDLIVTLSKNGIQTSPKFVRRFTDFVKEKRFWPKRPLQSQTEPTDE
jgi:hypothetical protein